MKKTHQEFRQLARHYGASVGHQHWNGSPRRIRTIAKFSTGDPPKLFFNVSYRDGQLSMERPERGWLHSFTLEDFEQNFQLMCRIREFIKEMQE